MSEEEQENAWIKIERVMNCTSLIGIVLKKAIMKGDDFDHLTEESQKGRERRPEAID